MTLNYTDAPDYQVEEFDHVSVRVHGYLREGQVTKVIPTKCEVRVRYIIDFYRTTGRPKFATSRFKIEEVEFDRRDG